MLHGASAMSVGEQASMHGAHGGLQDTTIQHDCMRVWATRPYRGPHKQHSSNVDVLRRVGGVAHVPVGRENNDRKDNLVGDTGTQKVGVFEGTQCAVAKKHPKGPPGGGYSGTFDLEGIDGCWVDGAALALKVVDSFEVGCSEVRAGICVCKLLCSALTVTLRCVGVCECVVMCVHAVNNNMMCACSRQQHDVCMQSTCSRRAVNRQSTVSQHFANAQPWW